MKSIALLDHVTYRSESAHAEPLHVDANTRALLFCLRPGQVVKDHTSPHSPVIIVVLKGQGYFAGGGTRESQCGPNTLLVIAAGEHHAVRAGDEEVVFLAILQGAPGYT